jgi:NAD-dependent DNA ligase
LTSSYLYYKEDLNVLTDTDYDLLCHRLYQKFDEVTHPHKNLIDKESLGAGTGYGLEQYPTRVKMAALCWYNEWKEEDDATS